MHAKSKLCSVMYGLAIMAFLTVWLPAFPAHGDTADPQAPAVLVDNDCAKCHAGEANDLAEAGAAHLSVNCRGCHADHPPRVAKPIAPCEACHLKSRKDHFDGKMPDCLKCHTNPHRPLNISLAGAGSDACMLCHGPEVRLFKQYKSKHQTLDCSRCHDAHRKIPQCTQCHKPHWTGMSAVDCKNCHNGHMPKVESFPADTRSTVCGSCHQKTAELLSATKSKHKALACTGCHGLKHKFKPDCRECHRAHHPESILAGFPECVMCHYNVHDLNNWPEAASEAPKQLE